MTISAYRAKRPEQGDLERGESLFRKGTEFLKGVVATDGLPSPDRIETCFCGRSNAGKSSLINALAGSKSLARTSNTPGRTREINFFTLDVSHYIVDLPGYGYAKMSKTEAAKCQKIMHSYLRGRPNLRRVFVLIDSRHGCMKNDIDFMTMLNSSAVAFQIVLTKLDKLRRADESKLLGLCEPAIRKFPVAMPEVIMTSSRTGIDIDILRTVIASLR